MGDDMKSLTITYLWQAFLFATILIGGAYIFVCLESPGKEIKAQSEASLRLLENRLRDTYNISQYELDNYANARVYTENLQGGLEPIDAIFLCFSIAYTTGWGYFVPTTKESKLFFLFYSGVSISICTVVLKTISQILLKIISYLLKRVEVCLFGASSGSHHSLKCFGISCILMIVFIIVTSSAYAHIHLSTIDSIYSTFQTYTTIGFGDLSNTVQKHFHSSDHFFFNIFLMIWNTIGMALLATIINAAVQLQQKGAEMSLQRMNESLTKARLNAALGQKRERKSAVRKGQTDSLIYVSSV